VGKSGGQGALPGLNAESSKVTHDIGSTNQAAPQATPGPSETGRCRPPRAKQSVA